MTTSGDGREAGDSTSSASWEELLAQATGAVRRSAAFALNPGEELRIEAKAHRNDLVTQVDRGVEERIARHLEITGIPIHGEEAHRVEDFETYRGRAWVLDPIDGTLNYVATHRDWPSPWPWSTTACPRSPSLPTPWRAGSTRPSAAGAPGSSR